MTEETKQKGVTRREFIIGGGAVVVGGAVGAIAGSKLFPRTVEKQVEVIKEVPKEVIKEVAPQYPASTAYLVYDSAKCMNCETCMMACSTVHEGQPSIALSRIQVLTNAFEKFPDDLDTFICRQCVSPACVQACPTGACHIDTANGNVRVIDQAKCIGCQSCLKACPHTPHRIIWNAVAKKATKCDLCITATFWSEKGGPAGKQACVEVCPHKALKVVKETPTQTDTNGYNVNLKSKHYIDIITLSAADAAKDYLKDNPDWWPVKTK
jgi:protein NrfC